MRSETASISLRSWRSIRRGDGISEYRQDGALLLGGDKVRVHAAKVSVFDLVAVLIAVFYEIVALFALMRRGPDFNL